MRLRTSLLLSLALTTLAAGSAAQVGFVADVAPVRPREHVLTGYYPYWVQVAQPPSSIDLASLTRIAHAFVWPDAAGNLTVPAGFFALDLPIAAHAVGTEAVLSVGDGGSAAAFGAMVANPIARLNFIVNVLGLVTTYGYDGVNLDWEFPAGPTEATNLVTLMEELRIALGPDAVLDIAVPPTAWNGQWFYPALAKHPDQLLVMAYNFHGGWSAVSDHNAPLYASACGSVGGWVDLGIAYWLGKGVPARQLVLGVPFYGRSFDGGTLCAPFSSSSAATYATLHPLIDAGYSYNWDAAAQVPYLTEDAGHGLWSFDDATSTGIKAAYARDAGLGGVMIWHVAGDVVDGTHRLLPAIVKALR